MTRKQIIAAAKLFGYWNGQTIEMNDVGLERFCTIIANRVKEECAALCYEQNWLIHGSEMSALILATKEEVK